MTSDSIVIGNMSYTIAKSVLFCDTLRQGENEKNVSQYHHLAWIPFEDVLWLKPHTIQW